ncbi:MAG: helicase C-terminal domain-containing protein [Eubacteriales bacterium]|nr:helicase C-terminal domain-containing protein [Eubacteriales bacterium]
MAKRETDKIRRGNHAFRASEGARPTPVNVRTLAEFTLLSGDLIFDREAMERMREGTRGHVMLQQAMDETWQREVWVSRDECFDGVNLRIHGRADAVCRTGGLCVQEIKTTRLHPGGIRREDYPAHWAQAQLYAYLLAENEGFDEAEVTLVYYRMDGASKRFSQRYDRGQLRDLFLRYAVPYANWIRGQDQWHALCVASAQAMKFPYDGFRQGQREMAREVYLAARDGRRALIEAPTGIGKTAAALFGAIKAVGEGHPGPIFYLTARTTGKRAAEHALRRMRSAGLRMRAVTLTAKEKCCPEGDLGCDGCPLTSGYYDRRRDAIREAMAEEELNQAALADLAREHRLCPFEFSLDVAETADVVICDYNYVFDPQVRLKRFFDGRSDAILLVDEAHNLPVRAREMYSCTISPAALETLCRQMEAEEGKGGPFQRAAGKLLSALPSDLDGPQHEAGVDKALIAAAERFVAETADVDKTRDAALFVLEVQRFAKLARGFDEESYRLLFQPEGRRAQAKLWCFHPAPYLQKTFDKVGGVALFSATLTPMYYYARQLGLREETGDRQVALPSPFPPENLLVLRLNLPTTLRERERTLDGVVKSFHAMGEAWPGNYLACFPSHAYLALAYKRFRLLYPDCRAIYQKSRMSEEERKRFLESFQPHPKESMYAFIAMGGVFAEGVDLPDDRLSGAAIVSSGIPQIDMENELLRELADDGDEGYDFAYVYPGIRRVLQAAGRVIRTETDRGVVLLIDERFRMEKYEELLPEHWHVEDVRAMSELKKRIRDFWRA